jgi:hypothetical protein
MVIFMFGTLIDGICLMIVHHWYYLISTTNWYLFEIHGYDTWSHIGRCTLFGILVDAYGWHGWHIGRCTWLS